MKTLLCLLVMCVSCSFCYAQGAGNAMQNYNDSYATAGQVDFNFEDEMTVMGWMKWNCEPHEGENWANVVSINKKSRGDQGQFWIQHDRNNNKLEFALELESGRRFLWSQTHPEEGEWVHFAGTYDGSEMRFYINGVEEGHRKRSGNIRPFETDFELTIGCWAAYNYTRNFMGDVDEISIWSRALSEDEIRFMMCRKINDAAQEGLLAYYQMDISEGVLADLTGSYDAIVNNSVQILSTAPIGDESVYAYGNHHLDLMATDHSIELSDFTGNPSGIHIYKIDEAPNTINSYSEEIVQVIDASYWGVFIAGGNNVSFKYAKRLNANTDIPISDSLTIAYRENAASLWNWQDVNKNIEDSVGFFITDGTFSHREYILVKADPNVLPVELLFFEPICGADSVAVLEWSTATETNNDYFTISKSLDGINWKEIGTVPGQGTSYTVTDYRFEDHDLTGNEQAYFYKLKQTDYDGKFEEFEIKAIFCKENRKNVEIYPNPIDQEFTLEFNNPFGEAREFNMSVYDAKGINVYSKHETAWQGHNSFNIFLPQLSEGTYYLQIKLGKGFFYSNPILIRR